MSSTNRYLLLAAVALILVGASAIQALMTRSLPARTPTLGTALVHASGPATPTQFSPSQSESDVISDLRRTQSESTYSTPAPTSTISPTPTPVPPTPTPTVRPPTKTGSDQPPSVAAEYVVVMDEASGQILYEKDSHHRVAPASLTKIMTAIVALDRGDPNAMVKVHFDSTELVDSTLMGLHVGDEMHLEDLLYGLMLPSGNDAALAIAEYVGGSKEEFVQMMNQKAREIGLEDTRFKNPHGLDEDGHYSSAYDMATMARYGMLHYPLFAKLAAARSWEIHANRSWEIFNLNRFLLANQDLGADGVKIGYTEEAGRTIVASATKDGHRVYVVAMHSEDIVQDTVPYFNFVWDNYTWPQTSNQSG